MDDTPIPAPLRVRSLIETCKDYIDAEDALRDSLTNLGIGDADTMDESPFTTQTGQTPDSASDLLVSW